jgi:hypothetical protein
MSEQAVRAIVPIIPLILIFGCVGAAFATHDWDVQATLVGEQPFEALGRLVPAESNVDGEVLEFTDFQLADNNTKLMLEVTLHSPVNVPVTIKELSTEFALAGSTVTLRLPQEVEVPAQGSASLTLAGSLPEMQDTLTVPPLETFAFRGMKLTLDVYGIQLKLEESGQGGAPN